jgi:hypothetical protein
MGHDGDPCFLRWLGPCAFPSSGLVWFPCQFSARFQDWYDHLLTSNSCRPSSISSTSSSVCMFQLPSNLDESEKNMRGVYFVSEPQMSSIRSDKASGCCLFKLPRNSDSLRIPDGCIISPANRLLPCSVIWVVAGSGIQLHSAFT